MNIDEIKKRFRRIDVSRYPLLQGLTSTDIYKGEMGPGGLILASEMSSRIPLAKGMCVMDLGCGKGTTSVFLARQFGVTVSAVDLWIPVDELAGYIREAQCEESVFPFNADVTKGLPFNDGSFDLIFCMDAWHYFGAEPGLIQRLSSFLKPGGYIVVGNPCFDREFEQSPPPVYQAFWPNEFSKYHSPKWWQNLFEQSAEFTDVRADEVADGVILWEDALLHALETGNTKGGRLEADADEIVFGHEHPQYPYLTHYILIARKVLKP